MDKCFVNVIKLSVNINASTYEICLCDLSLGRKVIPRTHAFSFSFWTRETFRAKYVDATSFLLVSWTSKRSWSFLYRAKIRSSKHEDWRGMLQKSRAQDGFANDHQPRAQSLTRSLQRCEFARGVQSRTCDPTWRKKSHLHRTHVARAQWAAWMHALARTCTITSHLAALLLAATSANAPKDATILSRMSVISF